MATFHLGFVSASAVFASHLSRAQRDAALQAVEVNAEEGGRCIRDDLAEQFAAVCDLAVKHVLRARGSRLKTLRVEVGYGFAEHQKDWVRLGCEIFVDEEEMDEAYEFLEAPNHAALLESRLRAVTADFSRDHLPPSLFSELSCVFYLMEEPENA